MSEISCQLCVDLEKWKNDSHRAWAMYRPQFSGDRPPSRWMKSDRQGKINAEKAYNTALAKYSLHRMTHSETPVNEREAFRNQNILLRGGRLEP